MNMFKPALLITTLSVLAGCSMLGLDSDPTYERKDQEALYKDGSLISDQGGISLLGGSEKKADESSGLGVNAYLWRATLDTISFMPLVSADPFGGVIITDWYTTSDTPGERTKLNVFIRGRDLRADGVKVSVFRQTKGADGNWTDTPAAAATGSSLENAILTKARQIRMAQKQAQ